MNIKYANKYKMNEHDKIRKALTDTMDSDQLKLLEDYIESLTKMYKEALTNGK